MASTALVLSTNFRCQPQANFDALPEALLFLVAFKLDSATDLCSFEAVNKLCRTVSSDNCLWKRLCCDKFGAPSSAQPPSWKELYKFNHQFLYGVIFSRRRMRRELVLSDGIRLVFPY